MTLPLPAALNQCSRCGGPTNTAGQCANFCDAMPGNIMSESEVKAPYPNKPSLAELFSALRQAFDPEEYEWLPQPVGRDGTKQKCDFCASLGKSPWHKCPAIHVPFIGHAAVTDRLNRVDPQWNYRPFAIADDGTPKIRVYQEESSSKARLILWIWLKVLDVERPGVGDVWADDDTDSPEKILISDAIRNAAMRFGVGLELWRKDPNRPIHYVNESGHWNHRVAGPPAQAVYVPMATSAEDVPGMVRVQGQPAFGCRTCGFKTTGPNHNEQARAHSEKHKKES